MDENIKWHQAMKIERILDNIRNNNMKGFYVKTREDLINKIKELVSERSVVGVGDSMTLFETGIIDLLRKENYIFLDKYKEGLTRAEKDKLYSDIFSADTFLCSTNAITEKGELYNIDGYGNRVSAM
ncbi:lactate utilization protein [Iocasia frigidifontis]|uniref:lactate utilization protein n=2 Tax=Halanaerobiaceae TaxID=972 RepID=UPI001E3915C7|nr:lactate utilization protein [Iocasia fonsfrigidae]